MSLCIRTTDLQGCRLRRSSAPLRNFISINMRPRLACVLFKLPRPQLSDFSTTQHTLACLNTKPCSKMPAIPSPTTTVFWASRPTWKRSSINTLRCLIGCTLGDFSALWFLQSFYSDLGIGTIMAASSKLPLPPPWRPVLC